MLCPWCAFDVIGILGALRASGYALSRDPCSGENILLEFANGIPQDKKPIAFMRDVRGSKICSNLQTLGGSSKPTERPEGVKAKTGSDFEVKKIEMV